MAAVIAGMASSHAYAFLEPDQWDKRRERTRGNYARRYGVEPPEHPAIAGETLDDNLARYEHIRAGLAQLRDRLRALRPHTLILIGDDQDENYRDDNLPQFALYLGEQFVAVDRDTGARASYRSDAELARHFLEQGIEAGFDLSSSKSFPNGELISHAHREPLAFLEPDEQVRIVLLFVNAIHVPAPTPARCYQLGQALRRIVEAAPGEKRVVLYASGGLSHFTAGYPWPHYQGPNTLGSICEGFDRQAVEAIGQGRGSELGRLTSDDLLANGDVEMRQWIVLLGALGDLKPRQLAYEPFYRGFMGMAVGYWELQSAGAGARSRAGIPAGVS